MRGSRRHRRGFIIFFGHRTLRRGDGSSPVTTMCPACKQNATIRGRVAQRWFTLYFLPIFPLESKATCQRFSECGTCKQAFAMTIDEIARGNGHRPANDHASAIALYNDLRDRPADGATLLRLLEAYDAMDDLREAESSARAFPAAMAAEPKCGAVLAAIRARHATA